jgi:hypothetical protein
MGGECNRNGGEREGERDFKCLKDFSQKPEGKRQLQGESIISKSVLKIL